MAETEKTLVYRFGELELDPKRRSLNCLGKPILLNAKAFDLLLFLVENSGRLISKDEILDAVWKDQFVEEANLSVQISVLRKALGDRASSPRFLVTIPGKGYQFIPDVRTERSKQHQPPNLPGPAPDTPRLPQTDGDNRATITQRSLAWRPILATVVVIVAIAGLFASFIWNKNGRNYRVRSLAVLPFIDQTDSLESDVISDGLAESVIFTISRLPSIRVMSSSSSFRYREPDLDAVRIGKELGVDAVLLGRLTQNDKQVVVRAEMVSTLDNSVLWGDVFTRDRDDIEKLHKDVAMAIGRSLALSLRRDQLNYVEKDMTDDPDAYQLYLTGRHHLNRLTDDGFIKARDSFQAAIAKDPNYALAHAGLAEAYSVLSGWGSLAPNDGFPLAKASALKAIELDETLAEGHNQLGTVRLFYDLDWEGAEREFLRTTELAPNFSDAHHMYAYVLLLRGSFAEARISVNKARELDPLSILKTVTAGNIYLFERKFDDAVIQYRKAIEMEPNSGLARWSLGNAFIAMGRYADAIGELETAVSLSGNSADEPASLAVAYALSGNDGAAREILIDLKRRSQDRYIQPCLFAMIHGALREQDIAFAYLEDAIRRRDSTLPFLNKDPLFDTLRADQRFDQIVQRLGLP